MKKFEQEVINSILKDYDNGVCITKLCTKYHTTLIREILVQNNRKVPEKRTCGGSRRKYTLNENYFEKVDSKDKVYFLGFIYADGFITKRKQGQNVLGITLAEDEPLEKISKYIDSNKPIKIYKKVNGYSEKSYEHKLAFISDKLVSDIEKLGVIERKTLTLTFPKFLKPEFIPHFIRGYFDGDGSVFLHKGNHKDKERYYLGIDICGTEEFLTELKNNLPFLSKEDKCIYKELRRETNCWNLKLTSNLRSLNLYHFMYKDCDDLYLSRKKKVFEDYIKDKGSETIIDIPTNDLMWLEE